MCISGSVGNGGVNGRDDVKTVQALLNLNRERMPRRAKLVEDGLIGAKTIAAIEAFQAHVVGMARPDGLAHPDGATIARLLEPVPVAFTSGTLGLSYPNAIKAKVKRYFEPLRERMAENGIDTPLRQAHFLAQVGHESAELTYTEEIASGAAYEGRRDLGNTQPGDGVRFKGRGLIQLTGRANYTEYGRDIGQDLLSGANPKRVATDPELAVDVACWFWRKRNLNKWADLDDVRKVTKRINGGYNGLDQRCAILVRAKAFLVRG
jgi:putative chitinase